MKQIKPQTLISVTTSILFIVVSRGTIERKI